MGSEMCIRDRFCKDRSGFLHSQSLQALTIFASFQASICTIPLCLLGLRVWDYAIRPTLGFCASSHPKTACALFIICCIRTASCFERQTSCSTIDSSCPNQPLGLTIDNHEIGCACLIFSRCKVLRSSLSLAPFRVSRLLETFFFLKFRADRSSITRHRL